MEDKIDLLIRYILVVNLYDGFSAVYANGRPNTERYESIMNRLGAEKVKLTGQLSRSINFNIDKEFPI